MSDGRQSLYMGSQDLGEGLGLGIADLGILGCDMGDGTVMLTEFMSELLSMDACRVAILGQELCQRSDPLAPGLLLALLDGLLIGPALQVIRAILSEIRDRFITKTVRHESDRHHSEIVIGMLELLPAAIRHDENLRGPTATTTGHASNVRLASLQDTFLNERIQVTPDSSCRDLQPHCQVGSSRWASLENGSSHDLTGAELFGGQGVFHNDNVT